MNRAAAALLALLVLAPAADASVIIDEVRQLQAAEMELAAALEAFDEIKVLQLGRSFPQALARLQTSNSPPECKLAGASLQSFLKSYLISGSHRGAKLQADANDWTQHMNACEQRVGLPSKRALYPDL
ncbi:MAG: hypothetical protein K0S56_320 [Microvirga sp.]|jgi:hypothetical protein|nr:hypothetical protein [Microvirga sp.]